MFGGIMAGERRVAFFLEDSAQEAIIPPLFKRLAAEEGFAPDHLVVQVLSARGGGSLAAFRRFLKDARQRGHLNADLLVVGVDANCKGFSARRDLVLKVAVKSPYPEIVTAIPDPHVERWYLLDVAALSRAAGTAIAAGAPVYKCENPRRLIFVGAGNVDVQRPDDYATALMRNKSLKRMPLMAQYTLRLDYAERLLPKQPLRKHGVERLAAEACDAALAGIAPALEEFLPEVKIHFAGFVA